MPNLFLLITKYITMDLTHSKTHIIFNSADEGRCIISVSDIRSIERAHQGIMYKNADGSSSDFIGVLINIKNSNIPYKVTDYGGMSINDQRDALYYKLLRDCKMDE